MPSRNALLAIIKKNIYVKRKRKSFCTAIEVTFKHFNTIKIKKKITPCLRRGRGQRGSVLIGLKPCTTIMIPHGSCVLNSLTVWQKWKWGCPDVFYYISLLVLAAITWRRRWIGLFYSWLWLSFEIQLFVSRSFKLEDHECTLSPSCIIPCLSSGVFSCSLVHT